MSWSPEALADLHNLCFSAPRPWAADEFAALLDQSNVVLAEHEHGFALARIAADEAELLTIAVHPDQRRKGLGRLLLTEVEQRAADHGAVTMFLDVAEDNIPALALYALAGYAKAGTRPRYYAKPDGQNIGAVVMRRELTPRNLPID